MVNVAQPGVVSFAGRGYTRRRWGGYLPGEFSRLANCELTPRNSIRPRPGILSCPNNQGNSGSVTATSFQNVRRFIGHWNEYALFSPNWSHPSGQYRAFMVKGPGSTGQTQTLFGPDAEISKIYNPDGTLFADAATYADSYDNEMWHPWTIEGFQDYNNKIYFIISGVLSKCSGAAYTYRKAVVAIARLTAANEKFGKDTYSSTSITRFMYEIKIISEMDIIDQTNVTPDFLKTGLPLQVKGVANNVITHFMYKDRLWIVTPNAVLFSVSTDPWEWRVTEDGGFVSMADADINWATPTSDTIYIFSDNKIDLFAFGESPNVDGQLVRVSNNLGADKACEYQGDVYFAEIDALFRITGTHITKITDLNLGVEKAEGQYGYAPYTYRIWVYYNYFIIGIAQKDTVPYAPISPAVNSPNANKSEEYYKGYSTYYRVYYDTAQRIDGMGYEAPTGFFMMNIDTGALCELVHAPGQVAGITPVNSISEVGIVPEGSGNQSIMYLASTTDASYVQSTNAHNNYTTRPTYMFFYMQPPSEEHGPGMSLDSFTQGNFPNTATTIQVFDTSPYIDIVVRDFAPDGSEYFIKKYRKFLIQTQMASSVALRLEIHFDDIDGYLKYDIQGYGPVTSSKQPVPLAVGINQRSTALHFRISYKSDGTNKPITNYWEIFDIRCLWTYTSRGPIGRDQLQYYPT